MSGYACVKRLVLSHCVGGVPLTHSCDSTYSGGPLLGFSFVLCLIQRSLQIHSRPFVMLKIQSGSRRQCPENDGQSTMQDVQEIRR